MKTKEKRSSKKAFSRQDALSMDPCGLSLVGDYSTIKSDGKLVLNQLKKANLPPFKEQIHEKSTSKSSNCHISLPHRFGLAVALGT